MAILLNLVKSLYFISLRRYINRPAWAEHILLSGIKLKSSICNSEVYNNNGRNDSCLTWLATSLEEKRRWLVINASPRGQCSK